jgi:hypothetical protein
MAVEHLTNSSHPPSEGRGGKDTTLWTGILLILLLQVAQTFYAMWLNRLFYRRFPPFFDSMGYTLAYANILTLARESGIAAALRAAFHTGTVSLPWIFTAVFSPVLPYSRHAGIWYQELWLTVLAISIFFYLLRYRGLHPWLAFCFTLPFVSIRAIYAANGGVSDFRMDLSLYVFLSCMTVWYLATYETQSWVPWALSGLFLLLATLNRATAPVYMTAMFLPVVATRVLVGHEWKVLWRLTLFWLPLAVLAAAALASNYEELHYYYFVWGADPNANLPLWKAMAHVVLAGWSIGVPLTLVCVPALYFGFRAGGWRKCDWKVLWLGSAPVLLLVLRGAGLNPFVSMPAVFGWLLFCLLPFRGPSPLTARGQSRLAWLLLVACALNAANGIRIHAYPPGIGPAMPAIRIAIERMHADAVAHSRQTAAFATAHILDVEEMAIRNVLVFDYGVRPRGGDYPFSAVTFRAPDAGLFNAAVPLDWQQGVPGRTDDEKFASLVSLAGKDIDYFLLPSDATIGWLEQNHPDHYINPQTGEFKRRLLATGRWDPLGPPLVASEIETVTLYRKR